MQIKLKKYFMIFLGATLVSTSGKRERNTLTTSREIPTRKRAGEPTICVQKSLNAAIIRCRWAPNLAAYNPPPFVCHALPILHISREPYHEERTWVHAITCGNRRMLTNPGGKEQDGVCHNWGVEGENLQYIGIVHSALGRRICPNILMENLLHKSLVVDFCV